MTETTPLLSAQLRTSIVVGVDASQNAVAAAVFGQALARRTGATCHLVHVVAPGIDPMPEGMKIREALRTVRPPVEISDLEIQVGAVDDTLLARAQQLDAGLIVLGGKHHSLVGRWLTGSTAVSVVRKAAIPVLVARGPLGLVTRILAGADATPAAFGAIRHAEQWADLFDAQLRLVHAVPVPPVVPEYAGAYDLESLRLDGEAEARQAIFPLIGRAGTERIVEVGSPALVLMEQIRYWQADLVVVARHDRGPFERLMLGSVTERLLDVLPTSVLVVPATAVGDGAERITVPMKEVAR